MFITDCQSLQFLVIHISIYEYIPVQETLEPPKVNGKYLPKWETCNRDVSTNRRELSTNRKEVYYRLPNPSVFHNMCIYICIYTPTRNSCTSKRNLKTSTWIRDLQKRPIYKQKRPVWKHKRPICSLPIAKPFNFS